MIQAQPKWPPAPIFELKVDTRNRTITVGQWTSSDIYINLKKSESNFNIKQQILAENHITLEVPVKNQFGYKEVHREVGRYLGWRFNSRLRAASWSLWIAPVREYCDKFCFYSDGFTHRYSLSQVKRLWKHKAKVEHLLSDNLPNLVPLVIYFGYTPKTLKGKLGKSLWKRLSANSLFKNKNIVKALEVFRNDSQRISPLRDLERHRGAIDRLASLKSTVIKHIAQERLTVYVRHLSLLALESIQWASAHSVASDYNKIRQLMQFYNDTHVMSIQSGVTFNPKWSLRRMQHEHDQCVERINRMHYSSERFSYYEAFPDGWIINDVQVTLLTSPLALATEGVTMRHCVASYAPYVRQGDYYVFSLRDREGERCTLGVSLPNAVLQVDQLNGKFNEEVKSASLLSVVNPILTLMEGLVGCGAMPFALTSS